MHKFASAILVVISFVTLQSCGGQSLSPWHTERLHEEFEAGDKAVQDFSDYLATEERVFDELEQEVYAQVPTGPEFGLVRYSAGSAADPQGYATNWNRTFEFSHAEPRGGVLLLHGMSDSPYSLHAIGETLAKMGYWVVGLRLPGHGTAPSGLKYINPDDLVAATRLAMMHLAESVGERPLHIIGYSTGAALAIGYSLDAAEGIVSPMPASLVLVSPAIRIHRAAALASFKRGASSVPGFTGMAWLSVMPEFDPFNYNSFATNAADVVHLLTRGIDRRIAARKDTDPPLPPILALKSTVDATVTTEAIVDNLLARLTPGRHELVLFDVNRYASQGSLLVDGPGPFTNRLLGEDSLTFGLTVISNRDNETSEVVALRKEALSADLVTLELPGLAWPNNVYSLSHVALPFPPDDALYGGDPPVGGDILHLGDIPLRGERDMHNISGEWLLRMRYNPFYEVYESRVLGWLEAFD